MHPNPQFRQAERTRALAFARARGFGLLTVSTEGAPLLAHVPFLLSEAGDSVDLHLVRSNPICRTARDGVAATLAVTGPDGYVSPDWYGLEDQVPTWNYVAVHLTGMLIPLPVETLPDMLARQSAAFEARLAPKPAWTMDKMSTETRARFLRMILPFRMQVSEVQSTFKLNQNKPDAARHAAAGHVAQGFGSELDALASLMREPPG
ncbi:FMN-binding negative transcriptional regulator [Pseudoponticoccus marisrubri]|uniref:Negative transcriptional regulator n=1 Tax=Pseudoponticoccus marisrubri TaxID=1685382 RepID=A0A0W7WFM2_9RHOB|nr:FMN-binding negative transcriptional regulator [Pseudoponticoccus marisrubri]KUF09409.1 negative transcriptional regulator [Pseudoponticoccus marisrubri]